MYSIREDMEEFRGQLRKGSIQKAYRALLATMLGLRTHFKNSYPGSAVSGLYQGDMDMTYFALFPPALKRRKLENRDCLQLRRIPVRSLAGGRQPGGSAPLLAAVQGQPMARVPGCHTRTRD